jgi:alpha-tubulin suppressor-like RCC1 family protein
VAAGGQHACGLRGENAEAKLWCWGRNPYGQIGDGTSGGAQYGPTRIEAENDWDDVAAGLGDSSCALDVAGVIWCWGDNQYGQLGDGSYFSRTHPVTVATTLRFAQVALGKEHACAVAAGDAAGELWCWGRNWRGQLGQGTTSPDEPVPVPVGDAADWLAVSAGDSHTCALKTDNTLWCWGHNESGQLGTGETGFAFYRYEPEQIGEDDDWIALSAGAFHSCGIRNEDAGNTLWCWGINSNGRLGDGTETHRNEPTQENEEWTDWVSIATGERHSCGIRSAGLSGQTLWCWGYNGGNLGDGTGTHRSSPVQEYEEREDWSAVSPGDFFTCGLSDGDGSKLWCWGASNTSGQLGYEGLHSNAPLEIDEAGNGWFGLSAGKAHACGLRFDDEIGGLWCWGANAAGQVGNAGAWKIEPSEVGSPAQ